MSMLYTWILQEARLQAFWIWEKLLWQHYPVVQINHLLSLEPAWTFGIPKTETLTYIYRGYPETKADWAATSVPCTRSQRDVQ